LQILCPFSAPDLTKEKDEIQGIKKFEFRLFVFGIAVCKM